jgi:hypothetical protein
VSDLPTLNSSALPVISLAQPRNRRSPSFALLPTSTPQAHIRIHQHFSTFDCFIHTHKMANVDPTTHGAGVESDLSHKEKMSDDNPTAQRLEMESDASHKEKMGGTADLFDIPDPDAHLSEAERKAIVCSPSTKQLQF